MSARRVVVVGAGVIGVTTAHALLADGHEVTLLEAAPTAASGTSQANGGFLSAAFCVPWAMPGLPRQALAALFDRQAAFRWRPDGSLAQLRWLRGLLAHCNAEQFARHRGRMLRLALLSRACLDGVCAATGVTFDQQRTGVLQLFGQKPPALSLGQRLAGLQAAGFEAQWHEPAQVRAIEPSLLKAAPLAGALLVEGDGSGDCYRFAQGLLDWCRARGLRFEPDTRVDALELASSGGHRRLCAVRAGARRWSADAWVFAAGVDSVRLLQPHLRLPVVPVKGCSITAPLATGEGPRLAVVDDTSKLAMVRLGDRLRLAGMAEVVGHDRRIDPARCEQLTRSYEALYGSLPRAGLRLWAGLRPMTPDSTPLIGATAIDGLYLNTGHGSYGWTLACGSARLLADVLAGRPAPLDPDAYALDPRLRARG